MVLLARLLVLFRSEFRYIAYNTTQNSKEIASGWHVEDWQDTVQRQEQNSEENNRKEFQASRETNSYAKHLCSCGFVVSWCYWGVMS